MAILWFLLAPIAEEPILLNIFGKDFTNYKKTTPKFINIQSIKKLFRRK
jgi:protein-S-isoprenylcysteine O-methyltransferase Ste14